MWLTSRHMSVVLATETLQEEGRAVVSWRWVLQVSRHTVHKWMGGLALLFATHLGSQLSTMSLVIPVCAKEGCLAWLRRPLALMTSFKDNIFRTWDCNSNVLLWNYKNMNIASLTGVKDRQSWCWYQCDTLTVSNIVIAAYWLSFRRNSVGDFLEERILSFLEAFWFIRNSPVNKKATFWQTISAEYSCQRPAGSKCKLKKLVVPKLDSNGVICLKVILRTRYASQVAIQRPSKTNKIETNQKIGYCTCHWQYTTVLLLFYRFQQQAVAMTDMC